MKVPTIEQDVLPSVQTSQALKYDIERRSEIPVAKGGVAVAAAVSSLADSLTGIGDKMRDAEMSEEYYRKRTDLMTQSHQIMTDIQTKDPNFKNYTEEELFNIYNEKANVMRDGLFGDIKWAKVKEKLSNDYELTDVNNRTNLQVAGWKNTITRAEQDMNNHLMQYSNLAADSGDLGLYNQLVDSELAGRVSLGIITPEEAVTKKTTYNNNTIATYSDKYITEGIKTGAVYKDAYNNLTNQINTLQEKGIVVSPHIKAQILSTANVAYNQRLGQDREWLNKEGNDVCSLWALGGPDRSNGMRQKLDAFDDKNLKADFERNWEIAGLHRAKALERTKSNIDNQALASDVDYARKTGEEMPGMRDYLLSGVKKDSEQYMDINAKIDSAKDTGKIMKSVIWTSPEQDAQILRGWDALTDNLAKSTNVVEQRRYNFYKEGGDYIRARVEEKYNLIAKDPYTYVTDSKWLGIPQLPLAADMAPEMQRKIVDSNLKEAELAQVSIGVPREKISYMAEEQSKKDVMAMTQSDATEVVKLLNNRKTYYGDRFPSIERQYMRNGAPPAFQVSYFAGGDPQAQQRALDLFGTTEAKIKESAKAINPSLNSIEVENKIKKELSPYLESKAFANYGQPGVIDNETIGLVNGLNMYAHSMIADKFSTNDAIKAATNLVNSKYEFQGTYRVPKTYNADTISERLAYIELTDLPKMELYKPYNDPTNKSMVLKDSRWTTDKTDNYVVLTRNTGGPVLDAKGKPIMYSFAELIELSYYMPGGKEVMGNIPFEPTMLMP